jgi:hypothetical protein
MDRFKTKQWVVVYKGDATCIAEEFDDKQAAEKRAYHLLDLHMRDNLSIYCRHATVRLTVAIDNNDGSKWDR